MRYKSQGSLPKRTVFYQAYVYVHRYVVNIVLITSVLSLGLAGCMFNWQRYHNEEYNFSISLPRNWTKEQGAFDTVILAREPLKGTTDIFRENINVVVKDLPRNISLETFFEANKQEITMNLPGVYNVSEGDIFAGILPGRVLSFNTRLQSTILRTITAGWKRGDYVYVVSCTCEAEQSSKYEPIFQKSMRSLRLK